MLTKLAGDAAAASPIAAGWKAAMFVALAVMAGGLLVWQNPTWTTAACVALVAWACSRAYYFAFYVIEKYVDPSFRFAGLGAAVVWLWQRRRTR